MRKSEGIKEKRPLRGVGPEMRSPAGLTVKTIALVSSGRQHFLHLQGKK